MAYAVQALTHYQTYLGRPPGAELPPKKVNNLDPMAPRPHGAEVYIIRASGAEQEVTLNDGKFATAVFDGETVTIGLKMYNGTDGVFDAAKEDKPLSLDAMIHPLAICSLPPRHPQRPPDEIEVV